MKKKGVDLSYPALMGIVLLIAVFIVLVLFVKDVFK